MSGWFAKKTNRKPNAAEVLLTTSKRVAETREKRILDFVPTLVSHLLSLMTVAAAVDNQPTFTEFNLRWLLVEDKEYPDRVDKALVLKFRNGLDIPVPNFSEQRAMTQALAAALRDPVKYGFECVVDESDAKIKVIWTTPVSPPEPEPAAVAATQVAPIAVVAPTVSTVPTVPIQDEKKEIVQ